jgi:exodeoxyribonuclease III
MNFSVATWNINSVRLRIDNVIRFLETWQPDVLCLQETKCPPGQFPAAKLRGSGYPHIADHGQSGYHGVAIVSREALDGPHSRSFCEKTDCRHVAARIRKSDRVLLHNLYVPSGGDEPDPDINAKFAHKLQFIDELAAWFAAGAVPNWRSGIVVGDLNVAPLECDVWSHKQLLKVVSHTPIETAGLERVRAAGKWIDVVRQHIPPPEKLYTWWSYRAHDWEVSDRGRRLDHIWATPDLAACCTGVEIVRAARGWPRASDHVPVIARFALPIGE